MSNDETYSFSLSDLTPSVGDLSRMPEGFSAYYEVPDFKVGGAIQTYANSINAKLSTHSLYCFDARSPGELRRLLRVEVVKSAPPKK
jgi:hypothetical protein